MAYMYDLQDGWYALVNGSRGVGFGLRWEKDTFPFSLVLATLSGRDGIPVVWHELHRCA